MKNFEIQIRKEIAEAMRKSNVQTEAFEFFWETISPFSQWHKISFESLPILKSSQFTSEILFTSAEQFMMFHKALAFDDFETGQKILATNNVREQKRLGREVKGFNNQAWDEVKVWVVFEGNKRKFTQNQDILTKLLDTKGKTLVEAAPDDKIWGIGMAKDNPKAWARKTWGGLNYLGDVLTFLRIELSQNY